MTLKIGMDWTKENVYNLLQTGTTASSLISTALRVIWLSRNNIKHRGAEADSNALWKTESSRIMPKTNI